MEERSPGETGPDPEVLEEASSVFSKKWNTTVVRRLLSDGPLGFSALGSAIDGVSDKVLSDCLDSLQEADVVERREIQEAPLRVEYELTDRGQDLAPVIEALETWGGRHLGTQAPTVLLADDDERLIEMHATWLEEAYRIRTATDGKTARERLDEAVDVLVTDRRMPGLPGEQLVRYATASELDCGVVVLSSSEVDGTMMDLRFDTYLRKPTTPADLRDAVGTALAISERPQTQREFESLQTRLSVLQSDLPRETRRDTDRYRELLERAWELGEKLGRTDELPVGNEANVDAAGGNPETPNHE